MPPAATPPRARTRPVFSGTSRILLQGRFQPTPRGYHRIPPRRLRRHPSLRKAGMEKNKAARFLLLGPPPSNNLRAFFLFYGFSLIFFRGPFLWRRAAPPPRLSP